MAEKLTRRAVDRFIAQADPERDTLIWDAGVPGLVLRLRSGSARFAFQYKRRGRTRRVSIGAYVPLTLDQARDQARGLYAKVRAGTDPAGEKRSEQRAKRVLFAEMAATYIADLRDRAVRGVKRGRLSTAAEFERLLDRLILPALGGREVEALDISQCRPFTARSPRRPTQANRCVAVVSAVLGFAARHRRLRPAGGDATAGIEPYPEKKYRERFSLARLAQLGEAIREAEAAGSLHRSALLAIRLLALTGMRRSEVTGHMQKVRRTETAGLRWADVDIESRIIRLRGGKTGARVVPLGLAAVELLAAAKPADAKPEAYVCPGKKLGAPPRSPAKSRPKSFRSLAIGSGSPSILDGELT